MAKLKGTDHKHEDLIIKKNFLKEWLEKLQQESWQLELLISGFALFGIYEGKNWINDVLLSMETFGYGATNFFSGLLALLLEGGWTIFFINLLLHVILRGLWIGAIGLRYVSRDIEYEGLDYSTTFTSYLKRTVGEYDDFIERLEKICSVLFAYTFLLFLLLMSLLLFFLYCLGFIYLFTKYSTSATDQPMFLMALFFLFFFLGFIVFIDFVTLGALKRIKSTTFSRGYMVVYKFYSYITLSFLYRPLLYNFIDEKYTRRLFFLSIPYIFMILFSGSLFNSEAFPHWSSSEARENGLLVSKLNYEDERVKWYKENNMRREHLKERLPMITLSQFMVDRPLMEIFIQLRGSDQYMLSEIDSISPYKKPGFNFSLFSSNEYDDPNIERLNEQKLTATEVYREQKKRLRKQKPTATLTKEMLKVKKDSIQTLMDDEYAVWEEKIEAYEKDHIKQVIKGITEHVQFSIDKKSIQDDLDCYKYKHPNFGELGILCIYPLDSLSMGKHLMDIKRDYYNMSDKNIKSSDISIPFYKVK